MYRRRDKRVRVLHSWTLILCIATSCNNAPNATEPTSTTQINETTPLPIVTATTVATPLSTVVPATTNVTNQDPQEQYALPVSKFKPIEPSTCNLPGVPAPDNLRQAVRVFFSCVPKSGSLINSVPARIVPVQANQDPKRAALEALFAGPTAAEVQAGYYAIFGADTQNISFELDTRPSGLAVVTFDPAIRNVVRQEADRRIATFVSGNDMSQIMTTLGQFADVQRVAIFIGDQPLCKIQQEC